MNKTLRTILLILFTSVFLVSGFMLTRELLERRKSIQALIAVQNTYAPDIPQIMAPTAEAEAKPSSKPGSSQQAPTHTEEAPEEEAKEEAPAIPVGKHPNENIRNLTEDYPDAVGWLMAEGAGISHPFAIGWTNDSYLHTALDGSYDVGGTLFLDCDANRDMQDSASVIYGHNMKNGTMFGRLDEYLNDKRLAEYPDVYVFLPDETIHYTVWSCMVVDGVSDSIYDYSGYRDEIPWLVDSIASRGWYINPNLEVDGSDRLLVLSTCNYSYDYARTVLVCVADRE